MAAAIVLGENIGTTITANLAALAGNLNAKRAALLHFFVNIFGVIWVVALFGPFTHLVTLIVPGVTTDSIGWIAVYLAAFHTLFNITNVLVLIGFTPLLVKLVQAIGKDSKPSSVRIGNPSHLGGPAGAKTGRYMEAGCEVKAGKDGGATSRDAGCRPKRHAGSGSGSCRMAARRRRSAPPRAGDGDYQVIR